MNKLKLCTFPKMENNFTVKRVNYFVIVRDLDMDVRAQCVISLHYRFFENTINPTQ